MTTETVQALDAPTPDARPAAWRDRVDDRLARLEAGLAAVNSQLPHLATKADLERLRSELHGLAWRLAGLYIAGLAALFAALRWLGS